ncbi:hypothetical protein D3C80_1498960 [compost metagenome]
MTASVFTPGDLSSSGTSRLPETISAVMNQPAMKLGAASARMISKNVWVGPAPLILAASERDGEICAVADSAIWLANGMAVTIRASATSQIEPYNWAKAGMLSHAQEIATVVITPGIAKGISVAKRIAAWCRRPNWRASVATAKPRVITTPPTMTPSTRVTRIASSTRGCCSTPM